MFRQAARMAAADRARGPPAARRPQAAVPFRVLRALRRPHDHQQAHPAPQRRPHQADPQRPAPRGNAARNQVHPEKHSDQEFVVQRAGQS